MIQSVFVRPASAKLFESGKNIQTGFENNIRLPSGSLGPINAERVGLVYRPRNQPEPVS